MNENPVSDTQLNMMVARYLGIKLVSDGIRHDLMPCRLGSREYDPTGPGLREIPNYCKDLHAIWAVVETLRIVPGPEWHDYATILLQLKGSTMNAIQATARERTITYLRAVGVLPRDMDG